MKKYGKEKKEVDILVECTCDFCNRDILKEYLDSEVAKLSFWFVLSKGLEARKGEFLVCKDCFKKLCEEHNINLKDYKDPHSKIDS